MRRIANRQVGDRVAGWYPAPRARLESNWWSGLAVASNAVVYFTDGGRVREVRRDESLGTVAGGGTLKLARQPVFALRADLSSPGDGLAGSVFDPGRELYVARWV